MHHIRTHGLFSIIEDMYLLNRLIAFVDIVIFEDILIEQQLSHRQRISACIVHHLRQDYTSHGEINRLFGTIADNCRHFLEMSQLSGIVCHLDGELIIRTHLLGIFHGSTAAIGFYTLNDKFPQGLVA